jgi:hypothetical protein
MPTLLAYPTKRRDRSTGDLSVGFYAEPSEPEEVEPDEWDLQMLADYESQPDKTAVSFDECLKDFGLTYEDLRD